MTADFSSIPPRQLGDDSPEFLSEPPHFSHPRIPEDIRVPWGLGDLLLFVGQCLLASFIIGLAVLAILLLSGISISALQQPGRDQNLFLIVSQAFIDLEWIAFLALWLRLRYREPFWHTIGWRRFDSGIIPRGLVYGGFALAGVAISIVAQAAANWHPPKVAPPIDAIFQGRLSASLFMLMAILLAPIVEETIFRGYIYPAIAKRWGILVSVLITGALFGLLHGSQLGFELWQVTVMIAVGVVFTWVRATTKTVVASYLMHVGYNSFLSFGFVLSTHFLRTMPIR